MSQTTNENNDERLAQLIERFAALVSNLEAYEAATSFALRASGASETARTQRSFTRHSNHRHDEDDDEDSDRSEDIFDEDCRLKCNRGSRHDRACCRRNRRRQETLEQMVLSLWFDSRCHRRNRGEGLLGAETPQLMPEMVGDLLDIAADETNGIAGCLRRTGCCNRRDSGLAGLQQLEPNSCRCRENL